jgi:aminomethyltransferase
VADPVNEPGLQTGPLHDRHVALGAKLADFGGWQMPIEYPGGGVLKEHLAVREAVGVFDVSHLGKGTVRSTREAAARGESAVDFVNDRLTNDLRKVGVGQAQYTLCCDDETGGVVDDLIAYVRSEDEVFLIPNAANSSQVVGRLQADAPDGIEVEDLHRTLAVLAVQGPRSRELVQALGLPTDHDYMSFAGAQWQGRPVVVCRTGYTGELGFELLPRWDDAGEVWDAVLAAGPTSACGRAGSAPATRCAPRWATRCTARTCPERSRRCRPAAPGPSGGARSASGGARRCCASGSRAPAGCCGGWRRSTGASRAPP